MDDNEAPVMEKRPETQMKLDEMCSEILSLRKKLAQEKMERERLERMIFQAHNKVMAKPDAPSINYKSEG